MIFIPLLICLAEKDQIKNILLNISKEELSIKHFLVLFLIIVGMPQSMVLLNKFTWLMEPIILINPNLFSLMKDLLKNASLS